jgi:hypothetical protein
MNVLTIVSPGLKVLFERVGKPEVINRPEVLRLSGTGGRGKKSSEERVPASQSNDSRQGGDQAQQKRLGVNPIHCVITLPDSTLNPAAGPWDSDSDEG